MGEPVMNIDEEYIERECPVHGDYKVLFVDIPGGKRIEKPCQQCLDDERKKTAAENAANEWDQKVRRVQDRFGDAKLPLRFKSKTFADYSPDGSKAERALAVCEKYADSFQNRLDAGGGLILCGTAGTGKTHLVSAIINRLQSNKFISVFMSAMSAIRHVKATYSRDHHQTESDAIYDFVSPDLLVLDEIGVQFGTDTEKMILFEIINIRYQNVLPTILISNLTLEELETYIGERVVDRMHEGGGAVLSFDWDSYRRRGASNG